MRVLGTPTTKTLPDPVTGTETTAAVALLVMDDETDALRGTGYYWARTNDAAPADAETTWRGAMLEGRGPLRSVELAFSAAEAGRMDAFDAGMRLTAAAEMVRSGNIDPDLEAITEYMRIALEIDEKKRVESGDPSRTANGLFVEENMAAAAEHAAKHPAARTPQELAATYVSDLREALAENPNPGTWEPTPEDEDDDESFESDMDEIAAEADPDEVAMLKRLKADAEAEESAAGAENQNGGTGPENTDGTKPTS